VEVAAEPHEGQGDFVVSRQCGRPDDRVVDRVLLRLGVVDVEEEAAREQR
jgi:hypothetical protein